MSETRAEAFMAQLLSLVGEEPDTQQKEKKQKNRAILATLRRSLAFKPGTYLPAFRYVEPWVPNQDGWQREAYYLVAGLFALHPRHSSDTTLAQAMGKLYGRLRRPSIEHRFLALLDADRDQLPDRLRRAVSLVKAEEWPINWTQVLSDLLNWFAPQRSVQRSWASDFYRTAAQDEQPQQQEQEEVAIA